MMTRDEYIKQLVTKDEVIVYKLFKKKWNKELNIFEFFTLYIGTSKPYVFDTWYEAQDGGYFLDKNGNKRVKQDDSDMDLAYRPGFHSGVLPVADQIGISLRNINGCKSNKPVYRRDNEVWVECRIKNLNKSYNDIAKSKGHKHYDQCLDYVPQKGFYFFNTNNRLTGTWLISGEIKLVREITSEEVFNINNQFENPIHDLPNVPAELREILKKRLLRK